MRGASLFIVVAPEKQYYSVKLIDLSSFRPLKDVPEADVSLRDPGLIKGMQSILDIIDNLTDEKPEQTSD